jgi:hypothetical protein
MARQAAQRAMSAPSGPREDNARLQKMPVPEPRVEPVTPARTPTAAPVARPVRVGTAPVSSDRSAEAAAGPSGGAPAPRRSTVTRSEQPDDSTAIIDWLLQGNRSAAER